MNAPVFFDERTVRAAEMRSRYIKLARTQRRLAHQYKRWAIEAEAAGKLAQYRQFRDESDHLWRRAKWHIRFARRWR